MSVLDTMLWGNPLSRWAVAAGTAALVFLLFKLLQWIVVHRLSRLTRRTQTDLDDLGVDLVRKTRFFFLAAVSLYAGFRTLAFDAGARSAGDTLVLLATLLQTGLWGSGAVTFWLDRTLRRGTDPHPAGTTTLSAVGFLIRGALWTVLLLVSLDNLGVDITALITGLGIGGIAVALALQSVLGDLFASLSIVLDKPFVIGDFITVNEYAGTVEKVGLKTTRLRSLSGEQMIFSNTDLLASRIRNYRRMEERRVVLSVSIAYGTPPSKAAGVSTLLRSVVEAQTGVRFERAHLKRLGEHALEYEAVYFVLSPDFNRSMDVQQAINLDLYRRLGEENLELAYPTRTLHLAEAPGGSLGGRGASPGRSREHPPG